MPWNAAASLINGMQDRKVSLFNTAVNVGMNWYNQRKEQQMNQYNWEMQKQINQQNRDWELEDQAYLAQREDTAIQRRAQDMLKAGINPLLAGGTGGAESGLQGTRNTAGFTPGKFTPLPNPIDTSGFRTPLFSGEDPIDGVLEKERKIAEIENINADTDAKKAGKRGTDLDNIRKEVENEYVRENAIEELKKQVNENSNLEQAIKTATREYDYMLNAEERAKANHIIEQQLKEQEKRIKEYEQQLNQAKDEREKQELEQEMKEFKVNTGIKIIDSIGNFAVKAGEYGLELYDRHVRRRDRNNRRYRP